MRLDQLDTQSLFTGAIVGEAAGEGYIGKLAVACTVRNRVEDKRWRNSYEGVLLQPKQFSCFNGIPRDDEIPLVFVHRYFLHVFSELWWRECWSTAFTVLNNYCGDITKGANHYHAKQISPWWAEGKEPCFEHKDHIFYRL